MTVRVTAISGGVEYLLGHSGCAEASREADSEAAQNGEGDSTAYYTSAAEQGEPEGRWLGSGLAELGLEEGGAVDAETMRTVFGKLVNPLTGERLGRAPYRYKSVEERLALALEREPNATPERIDEIRAELGRGKSQSARAYYDVTFSAPKSVSVLYASLRIAGRTEEAAKVWEAHRDAVRQAMDWFERHAGFSRSGYHGRTKDGRSAGKRVDAHSWIATRWDHTTNRNGDPQLHSHGAVLNRVKCVDGKWRAVDGNGLYKLRAGTAAIYERGLEERLMADFPLEFRMRPDGIAREIVGIPVDLREAHSSRRAEVAEQVEAWADAYQRRHGRELSRYERTVLAEKAALQTRRAKEAPLTAAAQNAKWDRTDREHGFDYEQTLSRVMRPEPAAVFTDIDRAAVVRAGLAAVQETRSTWNRAHLMAALNAQLDVRLGATPQQVEDFLEGLADEALGPGRVGEDEAVQLSVPEVIAAPEELRRASDRQSYWTGHRDELFALESQLAAEDRLVAAARTDGAPSVRDVDERARLEAAIDAAGLDDQQAAAARGVLTSGRRADVLIGPAGTGKSRTLATIADQWEALTGHPVIGLATSQIAANVLVEEGLSAQNITTFLADYEPDENGTVRRWLPQGSLLVVDESGMSTTEQLERVQRVAAAAGAKLLFTGDPEQLDAVGAGGAFRLLDEEIGGYHLAVVHRLNAEWEAEASLRLRDGKADVLREYDVHGRLHGGDRQAMTSAAVQGFLADVLNDKSSVLVVPSNEQAAELSGYVQQRLGALGFVDTSEAAALREGARAGRGDLIQTRQNDRRIVGEGGRGWVANRDVWRVERVNDDGSVRARNLAWGELLVTIPGAYLARQATLAYAGTIHSVQGRDVHTSHTVVDIGSNRQAFYVPMTRGRDRNTAYVVTHEDPTEENSFERRESTVRDVLTEVLSRDVAQRSATQTLRDEQAAADSLPFLAAPWLDTVPELNRARYASMLTRTVGAERVERLMDEPGTGRLFRTIREAELAGYDAERLVRDCVGVRELDTADKTTDVLRWRIRDAVGDPTRWIKAQAPDTFEGRTPAGTDNVSWFVREHAQAMDRRREHLGDQTAANPPAWALEHLGPVPDDPTARAEWSRRAGHVAAWRELSGLEDDRHDRSALGPAPSREMPEHRAIWGQAWRALGRPDDQRDYAEATDEKLQAHIERWNRQLTWAPPDVSAQLAERERRHAQFDARATLAEHEAAAETNDEHRAERQARAESYRRTADNLGQLIPALEEVHHARQAWWEHVRDDYDTAQAAHDELDRRHPVRDTAPTNEPGGSADSRDAQQVPVSDRETGRGDEVVADEPGRRVDYETSPESRGMPELRSDETAERAEPSEDQNEPGVMLTTEETSKAEPDRTPERPGDGEPGEKSRSSEEHEVPEVEGREPQDPSDSVWDPDRDGLDDILKIAYTALARIAQERDEQAAWVVYLADEQRASGDLAAARVQAEQDEQQRGYEPERASASPASAQALRGLASAPGLGEPGSSSSSASSGVPPSGESPSTSPSRGSSPSPSSSSGSSPSP